MKPDSSVLRDTGRVAVGTFMMAAAMLAVYAVIGRLKAPVALGCLYTSALTVLNFFLLGLTVQSISERAAEKQRDEAELAEFSKQMEARMRLTKNGRMIGLLVLIVVGIRFLGFDPLATILPIAFPTVVVRVLQIIDIKSGKNAKGSEKP